MISDSDRSEGQGEARGPERLRFLRRIAEAGRAARALNEAEAALLPWAGWIEITITPVPTKAGRVVAFGMQSPSDYSTKVIAYGQGHTIPAALRALAARLREIV